MRHPVEPPARVLQAGRLALGTAQFGLAYGIANDTGQVAPERVADILAAAAAAGIDTIDTAIAYGDSEARLGRCDLASWRVVSKVPPVDGGAADPGRWLRTAVRGSLERLRIPRLHAVLLHRPDDLRGAHGAALERALGEIRDEGLVEKIGISIYAPDELDAIWSAGRFDLVQAPFNVFDRRLAASGWLERLKEAGVEVHVRSIFLQGLLLMPAAARPARFDRWRPQWEAWQDWLDQSGISPVRACLGAALSHVAIDRVVVGVDGLAHLREILAAAVGEIAAPPDNFAIDDLDLIHPARWKHA